jgi:DNA-binding phage protein
MSGVQFQTRFSKREQRPTRGALYKAPSAEGDPRPSTLIRVQSALGIKLTASAV